MLQKEYLETIFGKKLMTLMEVCENLEKEKTYDFSTPLKAILSTECTAYEDFHGSNAIYKGMKKTTIAQLNLGSYYVEKDTKYKFVTAKTFHYSKLQKDSTLHRDGSFEVLYEPYIYESKFDKENKVLYVKVLPDLDSILEIKQQLEEMSLEWAGSVLV